MKITLISITGDVHIIGGRVKKLEVTGNRISVLREYHPNFYHWEFYTNIKEVISR